MLLHSRLSDGIVLAPLFLSRNATSSGERALSTENIALRDREKVVGHLPNATGP